MVRGIEKFDSSLSSDFAAVRLRINVDDHANPYLIVLFVHDNKNYSW